MLLIAMVILPLIAMVILSMIAMSTKGSIVFVKQTMESKTKR